MQIVGRSEAENMVLARSLGEFASVHGGSSLGLEFRQSWMAEWILMGRGEGGLFMSCIGYGFARCDWQSACLPRLQLFSQSVGDQHAVLYVPPTLLHLRKAHNTTVPRSTLEPSPYVKGITHLTPPFPARQPRPMPQVPSFGTRSFSPLPLL